ncbi:hypothetical protein ABIB40_003657 [Pedobacter sp. UYP30]|uniref:hypothetical protein n=1 Tax=Pedobacter sp. UYP30 TaxID=1756400 RepID=UPI003395612D
MKITYTKGWFRDQKRILKEYSIEDAKLYFLNRNPFAILIEKSGKEYCFVNINNKFLYVGFLDDLKREYLGYEFSEVESGKVFLKEVQFWEYDGDSDTKITSTRYRFTPDGQFGIEKRDNLKQEVERLTAKNKLDVSALYENYPQFGHYNEIIKKERELPIASAEF